MFYRITHVIGIWVLDEVLLSTSLRYLSYCFIYLGCWLGPNVMCRILEISLMLVYLSWCPFGTRMILGEVWTFANGP